MARYFTQLLEFKDITECPGPIVYWEQGHEHVFGDPSASADWDKVWHNCMHLPIVYLSVSNIIRDVLAVHYLRDAPVVPNAIDCAEFRPNPDYLHHLGSQQQRQKRVLIVGNPGLRLKNFQTALQTLNHVYASMDISATWICQVQPHVDGVKFPVKYIVNPAQKDLPKLYADYHDVFLFTSVYEAWGMPVLEAMASGVPVVTSRCHGVDMFCSDGDNCLMAEPFDDQGLAQSVKRILRDPALAKQLAVKGREVAEKLTWQNSMTALETALYQVQHCLGFKESKVAQAVQEYNKSCTQRSIYLPDAQELMEAYYRRYMCRYSLLESLSTTWIQVPHLSGIRSFDVDSAKSVVSALSSYSDQACQMAFGHYQSQFASWIAHLRSALIHKADGIVMVCAATLGHLDPELTGCSNMLSIVPGSKHASIMKLKNLPSDAPLCVSVAKAKAFSAVLLVSGMYTCKSCIQSSNEGTQGRHGGPQWINGSCSDAMYQAACNYVEVAQDCLLPLDRVSLEPQLMSASIPASIRQQQDYDSERSTLNDFDAVYPGDADAPNRQQKGSPSHLEGSSEKRRCRDYSSPHESAFASPMSLGSIGSPDVSGREITAKGVSTHRAPSTNDVRSGRSQGNPRDRSARMDRHHNRGCSLSGMQNRRNDNEIDTYRSRRSSSASPGSGSQMNQVNQQLSGASINGKTHSQDSFDVHFKEWYSRHVHPHQMERLNELDPELRSLLLLSGQKKQQTKFK